MEYETTPVKATKGLGKKVSNNAYKAAVNNHSTTHTLLILAGKHKVGLLIASNVTIATLYFFPFVPQILGDLISSL